MKFLNAIWFLVMATELFVAAGIASEWVGLITSGDTVPKFTATMVLTAAVAYVLFFITGLLLRKTADYLRGNK